MNKKRITAALLIAVMLTIAWAAASVSQTDYKEYSSASETPLPQPVDAQLEIFRISSSYGSEPVAPLQKEALKPVTGNTTIYSSALVWGESLELRMNNRTLCGPVSPAKCVIEQQPLVGGSSVIAVNFNALNIPTGTYEFTVITYPMPGIPGYVKTSDSILIPVNPLP